MGSTSLAPDASAASRRPWRSAPRASAPLALVLTTLGYAYAATLAPSITWANDGADSGDLVTAAAVGGVAHPTGYPTFLLLARAFQLIPAGDLAFRTNLLALCAALAAAAVTAHVTGALCEQHGHAGWAGALAALALGLAPAFWSQAIIAEVHSLNALFAASLALFALRELETGAAWGWAARGRGLAAGLALGNHVTIGLMVLGWLAAAAAGAPAGTRPRRLAARALWVALGLLVYLYLPLRAAARPPISWGGADTLAGLWWTITGGPYRGLAFGITAAAAPQRLQAWAALLLAQFGPAGLALGFGGLLYGGGTRRALLGGSAAIAAGGSLFALAYATDDAYLYLLPAYVLFAIWIGCGCGELCAALGRRGAPAALTALLIAALFAIPAPATAARVDARHDGRAVAFADTILAAAPAGAIIVTTDDYDTFALWYAHYALGRRPDIAVTVDALLDMPWYRASLSATYPWLSVPATPPADWAEALRAANGAAIPVCTTGAEGRASLSCR